MERKDKTNPSWHVRLLSAGIIVAATILLPACRSEKKASAPPPPVVTTMNIIQRDVPVVFEYVAQTQSSHLVNIQKLQHLRERNEELP
jgi:membrane fusion protein (multidrug efflux system)